MRLLKRFSTGKNYCHLILFSLDQSNRIHEHNTKAFVECIKTSHNVCGPHNLIAIKVTALVQPSVLKKFNQLLKSIDNRSELPSLFELINQGSKKEITTQSFNQTIQSYLEKTPTNKSTSTLTPDETTEIYHLLLRLNRIAQVRSMIIHQFEENCFFQTCIEQEISIMVDAEQSYFQTAINYLANELQRYYNKDNIAYIYGTYQCYLKVNSASNFY